MAGAAGVACVHGGCLWVGLATDWIRDRQRQVHGRYDDVPLERGCL